MKAVLYSDWSKEFAEVDQPHPGEGEVGIERAAFVLKNVRTELLAGK